MGVINITYNTNMNYSVTNVLNSVKTRRFASTYNRDISWEDCHNAFRYVYKKGFEKSDSELLALHLVGHLASWGMYRGSSDLLKEYKYLIHMDLIEILFQEKYLSLFNIDEKNFKENIPIIKDVYGEIENYYNSFSTKGKHFNPSETLITKIMLGVYACVPAYDRYLVKGLQVYGIKRSGKKKFESLEDWLKNNLNFVTELLNFGNENFSKENIYYPYMKLVDMYFCELGYQEENKK